MLFRAKNIAFSAAALLVAAVGVYTFMPDQAQSPSSAPGDALLGQPPVKAEVLASQNVTSGPDSHETTAQNANTEAAGIPANQDQPVQAPKKLTRQQLTPPPMTEDEKLQKAAEQQSNF